ncbi:MAG TPA: lysylphosphatidylglycerol synthase domain-containing protein [Solirubrobacteraceae bacterium]
MTRWLIRLAILVVVFAWLLPRVIDYHAVWDALTNLSVPALILLAGLSLLRIVTEASIYRGLLAGLRLRTGVRTYLSSDTVGLFLPPPAPSIVQYSYFGGAGFDTNTSTAAVIGTFVFATLGRLCIWPVAFVLLVATTTVPRRTLIITVVSLAVLAAVAAVGYCLARWEKVASWFGSTVSRVVSWIRARFRRSPMMDLGPRMVEFRTVALSVFARRWKATSVAVALNLLVSFILLLVAIRAVGESRATIGWVEIFAAFALAFWFAAVVPITQGGLGVVDVVLISTLTDESGASSSVMTAAVLIWRFFYSFAMLPLGIFTLSQWHKDNPNAFKRHPHPTHDSAVGAPASATSAAGSSQ